MATGRRLVPLFIEPSSLKVLFIGGGKVALRKAEHLRDCDITVISREVEDSLTEIATNTITRDFSVDDLDCIDGFDIVIAATDDPGLNDRVVAEARSRGVLVNSVSGGGDFMIPSTLRRDDFTICASTEGVAPVLPPFLISTIDSMLDDRYDRMARLIKRVRTDIRYRLEGQKERALFLESLLQDATIWDLLEEDQEKAYNAAMGMIP